MFLLQLLVFFLTSVSCYGTHYVLFDRQHSPSPKYDEIVGEKLRPHDTIQFSDGKTFTLLSRLNSGRKNSRYNTVIFEIQETQQGKPTAIRISKRVKECGLITATIKGFPQLKKDGVPIIDVFSGREGEYVLVERVYPKCTLRSFLSQGCIKNERERATAVSQLLDLVRTTAPYAQIGDMSLTQILYIETPNDTLQWILADWDDSHIRLEHITLDDIIKAKNIFSSLECMYERRLFELIAQKVRHVIRTERMRTFEVTQGLPSGSARKFIFDHVPVGLRSFSKFYIQRLAETVNEIKPWPENFLTQINSLLNSPETVQGALLVLDATQKRLKDSSDCVPALGFSKKTSNEAPNDTQ